MSDSKSTLEALEAIRRSGNAQFSAHHIVKAADIYSQAIHMAEEWIMVEKITADEAAIHTLYSNRAFCNIKLECYGSAITDATKALEYKPNFVKAFYRRGDAYLLLGKYKLAIRDFTKVIKQSHDEIATLKLNECKKLIRQENFAAAICKGEEKAISDSIDVSVIEIDKEYKGMPYSKTGDFMNYLFDYLKESPDNKLPKKFAYMMVMDMIKLMRQLPNIIDITLKDDHKFTICGDIHGQFYDMMNIFKINGRPSDTNQYLFNGDFVDRGSFSVEVIIGLYAAKLAYPDAVHLARGNHETQAMNRQYGFRGEVIEKYDEKLYMLFSESFCHLPLAHCIEDKVLVVHGGLFGDDATTLDDLKAVNRNREPADTGIMTHVLWSDPQQEKGRAPSKRGVAYQFGPDVTHSFLKRNNLDLIIRSHEVKDEGYEIDHDGKVITVFSAPNYCDQMGNQGAFIRFDGKCLTPQFIQFDAVEHPQLPPMKYANSLYGM
eukprot:GHVQ01035030.1.p1 GENE.GHVQ01035030.1~~GHVQ01035030.1.p1  ORF type:complete len:490 (+),score=47.79 GHVQ01035030.1:309-1778(+)